MGILFTNGFIVTPTNEFVPPSEGLSMRTLLSPEGQTDYDLTSAGDFFSCSLSDYTAVFNGYEDAQKIGNTDADFATSRALNFTATCATVLPVANSTIPQNSYIIGYATRFLSAPTGTTTTPLISTTYKGTYEPISNSPDALGTTRIYYLRKEPTIISQESYVGHVAANSNGSSIFFDQTSQSYTNGGFDCGAPYSDWTNRTGGFPHFQMIITSIQPY